MTVTRSLYTGYGDFSYKKKIIPFKNPQVIFSVVIFVIPGLLLL